MAKFIIDGTQAADLVKNKTVRTAYLYEGDAESNKSTKEPVVRSSQEFNVGSEKWNGSEGHYKLWNEIHEMQSKFKNAATPPSTAELAAFYPKLFIDVMRQSDEFVNLQPIVATVINRSDVPEVSNLRDYLPFVGKEKTIEGNNDTVPLIEQRTANTDTVTQTIRAFGFKDSLKNLLFNPIPYLQRVTEAAARISTDYKNDNLIRTIVGATYGTKHSQAADSTGDTYDLKLYNTLAKAYKTLGKLYHPMYTDKAKYVATLPQYRNGVTLLINPLDEWAINRVLSGFTFTGSAFLQNVSPIPIANVVSYAGGIQDGMTWGKETLDLPGVAAGTAYMFIPNQAYVITKRDTTLETGTGSVLELSSEERAWYRVSGEHTSWLMGGCATNTGYGCIIKITLPTES